MELMLRPDPVGAEYNHAAPDPGNSRAAGAAAPVVAEGAAGGSDGGEAAAGGSAGWEAAAGGVAGEAAG